MLNHFNFPNGFQVPHQVDLDLQECLQWAITSKTSYAPYAVTYIRAIPQAIEEGHHFGSMEQGLKTQILYVLSNLTGMTVRNMAEAKNIKARLKAYATS